MLRRGLLYDVSGTQDGIQRRVLGRQRRGRRRMLQVLNEFLRHATHRADIRAAHLHDDNPVLHLIHDGL